MLALLFWKNSWGCISQTLIRINKINYSNVVKKYHADFVKNILENKIISSNKEWKTIRQDILQGEGNRGQLSEMNIDSLILNYCISNNLNLGFSYIDFMNDENIKQNIATTSKFLHLIYLRNEFYLKKNIKCPQNIEKLIMDNYKTLRKTYPILDPSTLESCILTLSLTTYWRKSLDLLKEIEISSSPSNRAYSAIIAAAFVNNDHDLAWQLLEDMVLKEKIPTDLPILSYLNQVKNSEHPKILLEKLFNFFREYEFICKEDIIETLEKVVNSLHYIGSTVNVRKLPISRS